MQARRHRPSLTALRALAGVVTLLVLGGQALGTLHQLVVPHQLCAEHGHLIHAERPVARAPYRDLQGPLLQTSTADSDEHGHCALAVRRDELRFVVELSNGACVAPPPSAASMSTSAGVETSAGPPLLQLAPKQSPPV